MSKTNWNVFSVPPSFIRTPSDHEIHQGGNVELYCEATGDPQPVIRWFQNNNAVSPNNRYMTLAPGIKYKTFVYFL